MLNGFMSRLPITHVQSVLYSLELKIIAEHYRQARDSSKLDLALPDGRWWIIFV
jgi:hypothetical protein